MVGKNNVTVQFLGAAKTVTGSKYLLTVGESRVLVDCGLFQGVKNLRLQNWAPFPVDPKTISAIVLTHAHIDHSGYIPRLIKDGFRGQIFCTEATRDLASILLPDTGYLQEEEAEYMNRRKVTKHHPAMPLFSQKEAETSLAYFVAQDFGKEFEPVPGVRCCFLYAGHILGAATLIVHAGRRTIGFSGDVGRPDDAVFFPPAVLPPLDYLVVESTYGDRAHPDSEPMSGLGEVVRQTARRNGVILVPSFAVGRAQTILYFLVKLKRDGKIPDIPMYLNSPMATKATDVFQRYRSLHKLSDQDCDEMKNIVRYVESVEESKALNEKGGPMLILSASGMGTGGRILHHLKTFAPDANNSIVWTGFQAAGTRGQAIQDGVKEVKIHGGLVPVRAQVFSLENLSAHADYREIIEWLARSQLRPKKVFVTHGEARAVEAMKEKLTERFGWTCEVPEPLSTFKLE